MGFPLCDHCYWRQGVTGEGDVRERTEALRKAAAQCEVGESSINLDPNRFPTCVRCLPRNAQSLKQLHLSGKTVISPPLTHKITQSRVVHIKHWQSVEQTSPLRQKLLFRRRTFGMPLHNDTHTHRWANACFAHTRSKKHSR